MTALDIITSIFDMFTLYIFLNNVLHKRKAFVTKWMLALAYIFMEIIINVRYLVFVTNIENKNLNILYNFSFSFVTTFLLTLIYDDSFIHKLFASLIFQICVLLGSKSSTVIVLFFNPDFLNDIDQNTITVMSFFSCFLTLFYVLLILVYWKKKFAHYLSHYNILVFIIPVFSLVVPLILSVYNVHSYNSTLLVVLYSILALFNIVNFILVEHTFKNNEFKLKTQQLEQQIDFQKKKYKQLSTLYKTTRKVVHDVKKHYFAIGEYIKNQEYNKLNNYIDFAINDLESTYAYFNSGNLVIDSFLTNYKSQFEQAKVSFDANLDLDYNKIPVEDYDICIILGNILDNGLNATSKINNNAIFQIDIYIEKNNKFIIYSKNTYDHSLLDSNKDDLSHGYGLEIIQNTVEKYQGAMTINKEPYYELCIVIPINS